MSLTSRAARHALVRATLVGILQGVVLSAALFLLEVILLGRDGIPNLGTPLPAVAALYLGTGLVVGAVAGGLAGLVGGVVELSPGRLSGPVLVWFHAALLALRSASRAELAHIPLPLIGVLVAGVAVVVSAWIWAMRARPVSSAPLRGPLALTSLAVLIALLCALWAPLRVHSLPSRAGAAATAPNVLFVLVDAMRADRLSAVGYPRPTTPVVDRLAAEGVLFENAYAHGNRTIISMPALFTSLYPALTGAVGFQDQVAPLPADQVTIAEVCRDAGYRTFAMMSNIYLKHPFGLTQGFDRVEEFYAGRFDLSVYRALRAVGLLRRPGYATRVTVPATDVTDAALAWLSRARGDAPVFCYVHYMDVHHPYLPPAEFERMFRSREELAAIDPNELFMRTSGLVKEQKRNPLGDDDLTRLSDLYDACIRYVDGEVGRLVDAMQRLDNDRPTVVVFTADHGDEFQEHGFLYHNNVVIQELIRVPLVVWRSDHRYQKRVPNLVRHVDVLPTLAEWTGGEVPASAMGRSLTGLLAGVDSTAVTSIAEGDFCSALIEPGWKVMRVDTSGVESLYDLDTDPWASTDIALQNLDRWQQMRDALDKYLREVEPLRGRASATTNAETIRQLRSLGYIN